MIHTAFNHGFSKFAEDYEMNRRDIEAPGATLAGSDRHHAVAEESLPFKDIASVICPPPERTARC